MKKLLARLFRRLPNITVFHSPKLPKGRKIFINGRIISLDFHLLRTFCVVAEEENVSRAAERLYLSAPSVSAHIKALEDELGVQLFTRSSRGMALTEAGHTLWESAEDILKQTALMRRKAQTLPWIFASEGCSLYQFTQEWRTKHDLKLDERIRASNEEQSAMNFVANQLGVSVVIEEVIQHSVHRDKIVVLPQVEGTMQLSLGYRKSRRDEALIQAAIKTISSIWSEKLESTQSNATSLSGSHA